MKPWCEVALPHPDVLAGTFQQSEFAADLLAVHEGKALPIYQDAAQFFQRTFITEGMRLLLVEVAQRLCGQGGEPVVQLQTAFGGGKTHTLLAVYHLATRSGALRDLAGVPAILDQVGLLDVPRARVAVLDGHHRSPGQPQARGALRIHTLWGDLAWQLGGDEGYDLVREADLAGVSPGKALLATLLARFAPCVVLIDELVGYLRQFVEGQVYVGGTYNSNLSFVQALTEAVKLVPNALILASLPESEVEAGDQHGVLAMKALEKVFGRVQALWRPVGVEESFEIVRIRLFEPIADLEVRDQVCEAFAALYRREGTRLPSEVHEARYLDRLKRAYPIHPEVFDRLYEDWTTLESFQRTRGVLKLMAHVIYRLFKDHSADQMILPGSLPLYDGPIRNVFIGYLGGGEGDGWSAVFDKDIDGERCDAVALEMKEARFGAAQAARRVTRTVFLGSAPASVSLRPGVRGLNRARVLLGCLQPGQSSSLFGDALNRLVDHLHYLNVSGDSSLDHARFWFDTRANLRREMEERKARFKFDSDVLPVVRDAISRFVRGSNLFDGVHVFTPCSDVPDDERLRLVVLSPQFSWKKNAAPDETVSKIVSYLQLHGEKPRFRRNRLLFLAMDSGSTSRVHEIVRAWLAWNSIVKDAQSHQLNLDGLRLEQARKEALTSKAAAEQIIRDGLRWLLCPVQESALHQEIEVECAEVKSRGGVFYSGLDQACIENEFVISAWHSSHLKNRLEQYYWKNDQVYVRAMAIWEDMQRYLYLPRLASRTVLFDVIKQGVASGDFGAARGVSGEGFVDLRLKGEVAWDDGLLLVEPSHAAALLERSRQAAEAAAQQPPQVEGPGLGAHTPLSPKAPEGFLPFISAQASPSVFFGAVEVNATTARLELVNLAEEIISVLASDPHASVRVTVEINAKFPDGAPDHVRRAVNENAAQLKFKTQVWE
ncbi:DUF499 domain-containing protein [Myxococcota bacterium]|nr:DUF499 domain-containing protein [Myxococcota bacterium]MBU1897766.1 DUF499 domain-containing protein [Myxococcota bacterium]